MLNVKTVVTASINTRPQDGCWSPAHAFQMVAAAVAYLLRSVDVGAQAPTPFPVKMPSGHLAQRAARRYRRYGLLLLLLSSFSQENTRLSTNCDSSAAEKKLSPTPLHYPLTLPPGGGDYLRQITPWGLVYPPMAPQPAWTGKSLALTVQLIAGIKKPLL